MNKETPLYRATISANDSDAIEVNYIALVDAPAIQKNFLAFNNQVKELTFAINEDEQIITGLAMVADLPIYRRDPDGTEFYVYFDAQTIKEIAQRFFRKGYVYNFNLNHNAKEKTSGVYIFESWLTDKAKGKNPMQQFKDIADGSWFISLKVEDAQLWENIKKGEFNGFSVEGFFNMEELKMSRQENDELEFDKALIEMIQESLK